MIVTIVSPSAEAVKPAVIRAFSAPIFPRRRLTPR